MKGSSDLLNKGELNSLYKIRFNNFPVYFTSRRIRKNHCCIGRFLRSSTFSNDFSNESWFNETNFTTSTKLQRRKRKREREMEEGGERPRCDLTRLESKAGVPRRYDRSINAGHFLPPARCYTLMAAKHDSHRVYRPIIK